MVKVCESEYPLGTYKQQTTPGFYMDGLLKENIDILSRNITNDMEFVGLVTGNGTVGNGKSTIAQQIGKVYSDSISTKLGKTIPFTINNIVFKADELITTAQSLPRYSCIILDEGDDLTSHYFSALARHLKRFFRKCRQLNLFIILILPDFFELPKSYAIVRSNFLVNVKFMGEFERGYFDLWGPTSKKWLYLNGKKNLDYSPKGANPNVRNGRFVKLYTVDEEEYRKKKLKDFEEDEEGDKPKNLWKERLMLGYSRLYEKLGLSHKELSEMFGQVKRTGEKYYAEYKERGDVRISDHIANENN